MKRLITIGDVHGNYEAFNAVIEDAINNYGKNISGFVFLGDYCGDFVDGNLVIDKIENLSQVFPVYIIKGNREDTVNKYYQEKLNNRAVDWSLDSTMGVFLLTCQRLNDHQLQFLTNLPSSGVISFPVDDPLTDSTIDPILITHIMPLKDEDVQKLKDSNIKYILTTHTHEAHTGTYEGLTIFNPGSVGLTDEGIPGAKYGVMTYHNEKWNFDTHLVSYDYNKVINKLRNNKELYEGCKHWGYLLELSVKYGINVTALYMFEVMRIARELEQRKSIYEIELFNIDNNVFGQGRYGNVGPHNEQLKEEVLVYDERRDTTTVNDIHLKTSGPSSRPKYISDEAYELALKNIATFLPTIHIEGSAYQGRREK